MKNKIIIVLLILCSCGAPVDPICKKGFTADTFLVLRVDVLDKYDNSVSDVGITRVKNGREWVYNEYFTGDDFVEDADQALWYPEEDSCELKEKYFKWLNGSSEINFLYTLSGR